VRRVSVGFFLQRTWKDIKSQRNRTLYAASHRIYPTREVAVDTLEELREKRHLDSRFDHDVGEVFMLIHEDP